MCGQDCFCKQVDEVLADIHTSRLIIEMIRWPGPHDTTNHTTIMRLVRDIDDMTQAEAETPCEALELLRERL